MFVLAIGVIAIFNVAGFAGVFAWMLGLTAWALGCGMFWYGKLNSDDDADGVVDAGDACPDDDLADTDTTGTDADADTTSAANDDDGLAIEDEAEGQYHFTQLPLALACHRPEHERPNVKEEREALIFVLQLWIYS
jgi:hypothetical protein